MAIKASRQELFKRSFVLEEEDLRKLDASLSDIVGPPNYDIKCSDGLTREFSSVEALLDFENPPARAIRELELLAFGAGGNRRASLRLKDDPGTNVYVSLHGEEEDVWALNQVVEDRLGGMSPWYARATRLDFISIGLSLIFAVFISVVVASALGLLPESNELPQARTTSENAENLLTFVGLVGSVGAVGFLLNRLRGWLFPVGVFAIGQGKKRHHTLERVRWSVAVAFAVSVAAAIAESILR